MSQLHYILQHVRAVVFEFPIPISFYFIVVRWKSIFHLPETPTIAFWPLETGNRRNLKLVCLPVRLNISYKPESSPAKTNELTRPAAARLGLAWEQVNLPLLAISHSLAKYGMVGKVVPSTEFIGCGSMVWDGMSIGWKMLT